MSRRKLSGVRLAPVESDYYSAVRTQRCLVSRAGGAICRSGGRNCFWAEEGRRNEFDVDVLES
jgi:hypothetical protein